MVTDENLSSLVAGKHEYPVGLKRRRNEQMEPWLAAVDESKWIGYPVGITARERTNPPRTRAQEVPSGIEGIRIIVVDSDERRGYEERGCDENQWSGHVSNYRSSPITWRPES